jgi:hypothetical protein
MFLKLYRALNQRILEEKTWKLPGISYFTNLRQTRDATKIPKTVFKFRLDTKETTYTLVFENNLLVSFRSYSIRAFSVFLNEPDVLEKI